MVWLGQRVLFAWLLRADPESPSMSSTRDGGTLVGIAAVSNDLGDRNRLQALADAPSDVIFIMAANDTLNYVSTAALFDRNSDSA